MDTEATVGNGSGSHYKTLQHLLCIDWQKLAFPCMGQNVPVGDSLLGYGYGTQNYLSKGIDFARKN